MSEGPRAADPETNPLIERALAVLADPSPAVLAEVTTERIPVELVCDLLRMLHRDHGPDSEGCWADPGEECSGANLARRILAAADRGETR